MKKHRHGRGPWKFMLGPRLMMQHRGCENPTCICREKCCYQQRKVKVRR